MKIDSNKVIKQLSYILFPRRCPYCSRVIRPSENICNSCKHNLPEISSPVCRKCGYAQEDCFCMGKMNFYDSVIAPYYYRDEIVKQISRMKFYEKPQLSVDMARDMYEALKREYSNESFDYICFVPFSSRQKKTREYNQSELLAAELSKLSGIPVNDALIKLFDVNTQHRLGKDARSGNVFAVFDVNPESQIEGKNILLVDDIKTTGNTLHECAKLLKIFGAERVCCICYAIAKYDKKH